MKKQPNIAVITNILPKYREDMYVRLFEHYSENIHIYCQDEIPSMNLQTIAHLYPDNRTKIKYFSLDKEKLSWQVIPLTEIIKKYDIVFLYGNPRVISSILYGLLLALSGKKIVIWGQYHTAGANRLMEKVRLWWWSHFNNIFLYTEAEALEYKKKYPGTAHVIGMNNGLNQDEIDAVSNGLSDADIELWKSDNDLSGKILLLSCARLDKKNSYDMFLDCLVEIVSNNSDVVWCIIGKGEEESSLKDKADGLGVSANIKWVGALYEQTELAPWFLSSVALIHPGAIGLSLLHAMGYGLPVITHDNNSCQMPEIAALKNNFNGMRYQYGSRASLIESVNSVLKNSELREQLSENALNTARSEYNTDIMANNFIKMVDSL
ncbi:hypothetical protein MNBD_GAMMA11-228 [hydrothermal vent metagenome]|uniref:Glycosyl transferase family 1 domain-containing protein n=1 Tax=hydrothermal vent metagenome TaxID=652676 RepID=A0A3B0Y2L8_9ZZZZ